MINVSTVEFLSLVGAFWNTLGVGGIVVGFLIIMGVIMVVKKIFSD